MNEVNRMNQMIKESTNVEELEEIMVLCDEDIREYTEKLETLRDEVVRECMQKMIELEHMVYNLAWARLHELRKDEVRGV